MHDCTQADASERRETFETFGSYARALRERADMAIAHMATRMGLSASHYNRIELGEKAPLASTRWSALVEVGADPHVLEMFAHKFRTEREERKRSRFRREREAVTPGHPGSSSWDELPWEEDDWCWYAIACHPHGMTTEEVAALTGCTAERIRQIELEALKKLAVEPAAVEAMEVIDDRENELAIWTVTANMR